MAKTDKPVRTTPYSAHEREILNLAADHASGMGAPDGFVPTKVEEANEVSEAVLRLAHARGFNTTGEAWTKDLTRVLKEAAKAKDKPSDASAQP